MGRVRRKRGLGVREEIHQGDIIKIEKIEKPVLVTSKDFFNQSGEIIGCPIFVDSSMSPLHIYIKTEQTAGYVQCEKLKLLDLKVRGYKKVDRLPLADIMNITDAIQGIFDYV